MKCFFCICYLFSVSIKVDFPFKFSPLFFYIMVTDFQMLNLFWDKSFCHKSSLYLAWLYLFICFWGVLHLCSFRSDRSDQSLSHVRLFATPWITARQASLSITNSRSSLRLTSIESVMPSSHLILCHPLLLLPPIPICNSP